MQRLRFKTLAAFGSVLFVACSPQGAERPENASGSTDIRFVVCAEMPTGCFVTARFKHIESCANYKRFADAVCTAEEGSNRFACAPSAAPIPSSYCTK